MKRSVLYPFLVTASLVLPLLHPLSGSAATPEAPVFCLHQYFATLSESDPDPDLAQLAALTDPSLLRRKMTSDQMSSYIKATRWQSRMVYFYSRITSEDKPSELMTPLEFVHSLADDLFQRKALQPFVDRRQKEGLLVRRDIMLSADRGELFTESRLKEMIARYKANTFVQK